MKTFAKFAAVAAITLSATAFAGAAGATTFINVPIGTSGTPESHAQFRWTGTGTGLGTLASVAGAKATLTFDDPAFAAFSGLLDDFTFVAHATVASGGALIQNGTTLTEKGLDGHFEFKHGTTLLLGGVITGGWLQGAVGANSANFNNSNGVVTYSSDIAGLLDGLVNDSLGFSLTSVSPIIATETTSNHTHLKSFIANSASGSFDAQTAVPEPATWGLMIAGFGGMGALLRGRRRQGVSLA